MRESASRFGGDATRYEVRMDKNDERPQFERDVSSDKPYVEEASVPGDNDPATAADRSKVKEDAKP